jgi:phytoene dehydrogenase-like protein
VTTERYDAIIVGGGHNGLVCAALLGKAGKQVLVLEGNERVGGAAITREFSDGYSVSACAHLLYQLQPAVARDLGLKPKLARDAMTTIALAEDGNHLRLGASSVTGVSGRDAAEYQAFKKRMSRFAGLLSTYLNRTPPRLGTKKRADVMTLAQLGWDIRRLGKTEMREFLRLIGMNIHDEVTERFSSGTLKGAISLDAVLGTHLGPRSPCTILTYLYRLAGADGRVALPAGGLGAVTDEIARAARRHGAEIRTGMQVRRIVVDHGRVTGVEVHDGTRFDSNMVISSADPRTTIMKLVGARYFETGFARRASHLRSAGNAAKLHLALDGRPEFSGLSTQDLAQRIVIAPDENYVERAFNPAKYGEFSPAPVIEITIPSITDDSLAPAGKHVLSAVVQYAPHGLRAGWNDATRSAFEDIVIDTISQYAPDLRSLITDSELLTPADIEREFHIDGGHWHHAELTLDQFLFVRPLNGAAQYALPIDGLFLCGAGAHPGGGVSGAPGRNAAREILSREKQ